MKLFIIIFVSIVVVLIALYFLTPLRYWNPPLEGAPGFSESIAESKERGVYVWKYHPPSNPYIINDSIKIFVKEAWLEHAWFFASFRNKSVIDKRPDYNYQVCVLTDSNSIIGFGETWGIGKGHSSRGFGRSNTLVLSCYLENLPSASTMIEEFPVYQGTYSNNNDTRLLLGKFVLIKDTSE